jgi:outer membrane protein TolC
VVIIKRQIIALLTPLLFSGSVMAVDLLAVYENARVHDAQYQAALMKFKGDVLTLDISQARYRPNINLTYRVSRNDYESDQLDVSRLDVSGCIDLACIVNRVNQLNSEGTHSTYDSQQSALVLVQPIYDASLLADNKKAAAFIKKSQAELHDAEKELIMRVVAHYLELLSALDEQHMLVQQLQAVGQLKALAEKRYQLGVGKELEMYDAQAAYDAINIGSEVAQAKVLAARQQLSNTAGLKITAIHSISEEMPVQRIGEKGLEEWLRQARENNDVLQAARAFEQVSYFDMRSRKNAAIPKFNFAATYAEDDFSGGQGFSPESTIKAYGIEMKWPIYQGGGISASGKQAAYRLEESRERVKQVQQNIEMGVSSLVLAVDADIKRYAAAQRWVQSTSNVEKITRKAFQNGSGTVLEWFEAQKKLLEASQGLAQVRYDYIEHRISLQRLAGELSVKDVETVNSWLQHNP